MQTRSRRRCRCCPRPCRAVCALRPVPVQHFATQHAMLQTRCIMAATCCMVACVETAGADACDSARGRCLADTSVRCQHGAQCCAMSCCVCRHVALYFQVSYCVVILRAGDLGLSGTSVAAAARAEVKAAPREERVQSVAEHKLGSVRTATRCDVAQRPCCRAAQRIAMQHEVLQHSRTCCNAVHRVVGCKLSSQAPGVGCAVPIAGLDEAGRPLPLPSAKRASFSRAIPH
jgi:hypothetical protein